MANVNYKTIHPLPIWPSAGVNGTFLHDISMDHRGEETSIVWFALFGTENYPPVERVARDNGITKIATVERYSKLGTFGLWTEFTTIVTGEGPGAQKTDDDEAEDE